MVKFVESFQQLSHIFMLLIDSYPDIHILTINLNNNYTFYQKQCHVFYCSQLLCDEKL